MRWYDCILRENNRSVVLLWYCLPKKSQETTKKPRIAQCDPGLFLGCCLPWWTSRYHSTQCWLFDTECQKCFYVTFEKSNSASPRWNAWFNTAHGAGEMFSCYNKTPACAGQSIIISIIWRRISRRLDLKMQDYAKWIRITVGFGGIWVETPPKK